MKTSTSTYQFSKINTSYFKGIGILLIFIHNYFHIITPYKLQNEIAFSVTNVNSFMRLFSNPTITDVIGGTFGFLGHFGVQIFIFFSAYGLSIQYSKWNNSPTQFIIRRLKKVYLLLSFGILFWFISKPFIGATDNLNGILMQLFLLITSVGNLFRSTVYAMFSGPYWFFALIIQLYIIFPILYKMVKRLSYIYIWLPLILSILLLYILYYTTSHDQFALFGNVLGHMPEIILGIILAQQKVKKLPLPVLMIVFVLFIASQFIEIFFPLSFLAVTILLLHSVKAMQDYSHSYISKFVIFTGNISMMLFIFNGPLRYYPWFINESQTIPELFIPFTIILYLISYPSYLLFQWLIQKMKW